MHVIGAMHLRVRFCSSFKTRQLMNERETGNNKKQKSDAVIRAGESSDSNRIAIECNHRRNRYRLL